MWRRELGVQITLNPIEQKTWMQNQVSHDYTIAVYGYIADYPDASNFLDLLRTGNGNNYTGWSNPAYDALLDQANLAAPAERFALMQQAEKEAQAGAPAASNCSSLDVTAKRGVTA